MLGLQDGEQKRGVKPECLLRAAGFFCIIFYKQNISGSAIRRQNVVKRKGMGGWTGSFLHSQYAQGEIP
jgi:hypothetical protein